MQMPSTSSQAMPPGHEPSAAPQGTTHQPHAWQIAAAPSGVQCSTAPQSASAWQVRAQTLPGPGE